MQARALGSTKENVNFLYKDGKKVTWFNGNTGIIITLFITFGDKNYGNSTIKIQNTTYYIYISN